MGNELRGQQLQTTAFAVNNNHSPSKVRFAYVARPAPGKQSTAIVARLLEYERYIVRDRDRVYGEAFTRRLRAIGIRLERWIACPGGTDGGSKHL